MSNMWAHRFGLMGKAAIALLWLTGCGNSQSVSGGENQGHPDGGAACNPSCGENATCVSNACVCSAGYTGDGVTCTGAACPALAVTNGTVSLAGSGTYGDIATYSCNSGFTLSGSSTRSCQADTTWSGTAPTCNASSGPCSTAPCVHGTCTESGTTYSCACDAGFAGTNCDQGDRDGQAVACSDPVTLANGTIAPASVAPNESLTYACNAGFTLNGSATRTCNADGTLTGTAPTCTAVSCSATAPTNGSVDATTTTYGLTVTYSCDAGYTLSGTATRTCNADGTLSDVAPTCMPVTCAGVVAPANGALSATSATLGNAVTYTCTAGYTLAGNASRTCQAVGTFSGSDPTCDPVDCGALTAPAHGAVVAATTTFGATATYSCNANYALAGASTRMCQADTAWSGAAPTCDLVTTGCTSDPCKNGGTCSTSGASGFTCACATGWTGSDCGSPVTCSGATAPANGGVSASSANYNGTVTYSCDPGYTMTGTTTRTCQASGAFTGTAPTCKAVDCGALTAPPNGGVTTPNGTLFGATATYTCSTGFGLSGTATRTCQAAASWSGAAPTCVATAPTYCDVVYGMTNGATDYGTFHLYNNSIIAIDKQPTIGHNTLLPEYGNTPTYTTMPTPFTTAAYPSGWFRLRYTANAAGTAPAAGPVSFIEMYAPADVSGLALALGLTVRISVDASAGLLQTTTTGCAGGAARCLALDGTGSPQFLSAANRCQSLATGVLSGNTITWDACSIAAPAGTTGTPSTAQLTFTPAMSVAKAAPADPGCARNMTVWGGVACTAGGLPGCGAAGTLSTAPIDTVWDENFPPTTLSSTTYSTATATIPEFIIPDSDANTYTGARVTNAAVVKVECGTVASGNLTCDDQ